VAQPALSRQIKSLEDELGAPLFARTPRGMSLLPEGEIFLLHARRILADVEAALPVHPGAGALLWHLCQPPDQRQQLRPLWRLLRLGLRLPQWAVCPHQLPRV
jgi:hypothetical protein